MTMTNRGKRRIAETWFRAAAAPAQFNLMLCTAAQTPTVRTNLVSELTEIAAGNGYTSGGIAIARNSTLFDVLTQDDVGDKVIVQLADIIITAAGGPIPAAGLGARWAILTDNNGTVGSREVFDFWDLQNALTVSDTQSVQIINAEIQLTTVL